MLGSSRFALIADNDVRAPGNVLRDLMSETHSHNCAQKRERDYSEKHSLEFA
jgi:hypothetical protein